MDIDIDKIKLHRNFHINKSFDDDPEDNLLFLNKLRQLNNQISLTDNNDTINNAIKNIKCDENIKSKVNNLQNVDIELYKYVLDLENVINNIKNSI